MARQMKDSGIEWIGEIPEGWKTKKLKYVSSFIQNKYAESYGDLPYIGLENIVAWNGSYIETDSQYDREQSLICEPGDILFGKLRPYLAKVYMPPTLQCCSGEFAVIRINEQHLRYMWYQLLSHGFIFTVDRSTYGTKMPRANADFIKNITIVVPTFAEQRRIADFLDHCCAEIDAVMERTKATIEKYKKLKQAVITEAVTKGVRGPRKMKDSGYDFIGMIPDEWEVCRLRSIGTPQNGISKGGEFFGQGFPFVSYGDVYKNFALPTSVVGLVESTEDERDRYSVQQGDIFFTRTSETIEEVGFSSVCLQTIPDATFAGFLIRVRPKTGKLHVGFSKYYFRSSHHRAYLTKQMNLVTRASLGQDLLKSMPVLLPSLAEQREIAVYLDEKCDALDTLIAKKTALLTELETYKKSLIYEYVTGKKEVYF